MNSSNILLITSEFPPQPGGIGNHALNLSSSLQKVGKNVTVLTDIRSQNGVEENEFDRSLPFKVHRIKRKKIIWSSYFYRIFSAMKIASKNDTVIASGKFSLWVVYFLQLFFRKKYIAIIHGTELLLQNRILNGFTSICLKKFSCVVAVSNYTKSLIEKSDIKNITIIPNGITNSEFHSATPSLEKPEMLHLITVGNVTQRKGQHNVIKSIPTLLKDFPKLKYHIVGIPTNKKMILKLSKEYGVEKNIILHGEVSEKKKWKLLNESSLIIMLSESTETGDVEGFGIAILEANALGLPSIGSINCGIEDAIDDRKTGILVDPHDHVQILNAVNEICDSYEEFSLRAKLWSEKFSWDRIINKYLLIIDN